MKNINYLLLSALLCLCLNSKAQQTVGLFTNTVEAYDGYTLFTPQDSEETFLINNCGEKVHSWTSTYLPGLSCYLLENGILLRTGRVTGQGGGSGIVEMIDWNGNIIWSHSVIGSHGRQHHDVEMLPNGNILLIVWDERTQAEVIQAGSTTPNAFINSEQIVEIQPDLVNGGATVVWEWKAWDHLVQDADVSANDFGNVSLSPEKIDINFLNHNSSDWLHFNGVDYNEALDQIIISVHNFSEFWIIDHSTSTAEAGSSTGGTYGKGGDLLYRWGNPQAYGQGNANDQKLFLQHNTHWIEDGFVDEGKIILYNNQAGTLVGQNYSTVNVVDLPVDGNGDYTYTGGAYGPTDFDWTYQAANPTDFYSNIISGVQRLENGNTLICEGVGGRFFEINDLGNTVWEYQNPVNNAGIIAQGDPATGTNVFRCTRYAPDYIGLQGRALTPQGYIESGSTFSCELFPTNTSCNIAEIFANDSTNAVCFEEVGSVRNCYTNNIPDHTYGPFGGNGTIEAQEFTYSMCLYPEIGTSTTELIEDPNSPGCGNGIIFGTSLQGINYSPFARLYWVNPNTNEENLNWHVEADFLLNMDLNGGHVNAVHRYHYHTVALDYFTNDLNIDGSSHSPVLGYAADGFPIYYKYLYTDANNANSGITAFGSSYSLKSGTRPGDGITAPDGLYDGLYLEDYEYIDAQSGLDECGMRFGITPEYPGGTYYYVLTDNWPSIPRCLKGLYVDNSFRLGQTCLASTAIEDCSTPSGGCTVGTPCNDGNACTTNDVYDANCGCSGTLADADGDGVCDAEDLCPALDDALIGTRCDDGDPCTNNDLYDANCECSGTFRDFDGDGVCNFEDQCPGQDDALIGTACNDGDPCTINDVYDANCGCSGTYSDADSDGVCDANDQCPGQDDALIGTACDDGDACTTNDVYDANCGCSGTLIDSDNDGVCDAIDQCPGQDDALVGTACDDGDACTTNDIYDANCGCSGTLTDSDNDGVCDANDQCPGQDDALIGTSCDDGDACTLNDVYDANCGCSGTFVDGDSDGVCDANDQCPGQDDALIGTSCDDGDACTTNDVYDANCGCSGTFVDSDSDGVCDANDQCPGQDDALIGTSCDDGDACTLNDVYDANCGCSGTFVDSDSDGVCDANDQCPSQDDALIGTTCDDGDACTTGDVYDNNCGCSGTFVDGDSDGVCDADDVCPGGDDTVDNNNNGIPDACDSECTYDIIDFNNFDAGWGIWNDGGSDCRRSTRDAAYANSGSRCVRIRDNTTTSVMTTDDLDLTGYDELTVNFSFITNSMETDEDFWLQISTDGGLNYITVQDWDSGDEFLNNSRQNPSIAIAGPFTSNTRLRFACDASANNDQVYIDDVEITGCSNNILFSISNNIVIDAEASQNTNETSELILSENVLLVYPNPAKEQVTISTTLDADLIKFYNMNGMLISGIKATGKQTVVDISKYSQGIYIIIVESQGEVLKTKLIKD